MNIQVIDFPTDALGETYDVRTEICKCLRRAATSATGSAKFAEVLKFTITKLKEADASRKEADTKRLAKDAEAKVRAEADARLATFVGKAGGK